MIRPSKPANYYLIAACLVLVLGIVIWVSNKSNSLSASSRTYSDKFITALPVDLSQVASISKFRSCSGHDYSSENISGVEETNRSMKHYIDPLDSLVGSIDVIKVFAPFDGKVAAIQADNSNNVQVGLQIWLTPTSNSAWSFIFYHVTPVIKAGDVVQAGQLIGYANLSKSSVIDFDMALEAWPQNKNKPLGTGNYSNLAEALHRVGGNYLSLLHAGQLDSVFNHMNSQVLASFAEKGMNPVNMIVSQEARDASPCPQPGSDWHYKSTSGDTVTVR